MPTPVVNQVSVVEGRIVITSGTVDLAVGSYTLTKRGTLAETTNSTTGGWERHKKVKRGGDLTAKVFWDPAHTPEALNIDIGDEFTCDLYIGDSGQKYAAVPFTCETIALKGCDQNGVAEYDLTAKSNGTIPDPA